MFVSVGLARPNESGYPVRVSNEGRIITKTPKYSFEVSGSQNKFEGRKTIVKHTKIWFGRCLLNCSNVPNTQIIVNK